MNTPDESLYVPREQFMAHAAAFGALHANAPTSDYVANIQARVETIELGGIPFPVTINDAGSANAWVCSPLTAYSRYAREEARRVVPGALAWPIAGVIGLAGRWLARAGLDQAVSVNNWLLSTNLYPSIRGMDFQVMGALLKARWPRHAIWFRSLNTLQHAHWLHALAAAGFDLIPSRQVYLFRHWEPWPGKHRDLRRDLKLLHSTPLQQVEGHAFSDADFKASEMLYTKLYIEKYSPFNPRYTAHFLKSWHRAGLLQLTGFKDAAGQLRAVVGLFAQGALVTAPIVGYDTGWPPSAGLYRLLMAYTLATTRQRAGILNLSAGAAHFKRLRGGEPAIEYSAVLSTHLPPASRRALWLLRNLTTRLGVPIMQRFQL